MVIPCPNCKGPIAKGFDDIVAAEIDFSFNARCPGCHKDVSIVVRFESDTEPLEIVRVIKQANIVVAQRNIHIDPTAGGGPRVRTF